MKVTGRPGRRAVSAIVFGFLAAYAAVASAADHRRGGSLFQEHCAMCHGATGAPAIGGVPDLRRGLAMMRPDRQLLATLRNGRTTMPGYLGRLSDRDLLDVIAYMRTLT